MTVKSVFDFKFSAATREEGIKLAKAIGNDMPPLSGYLDPGVIQDVADPGHLMVNTQWSSQQYAQAVLTTCNNNAKIKQAHELILGGPTGFVGRVVQQSA